MDRTIAVCIGVVCALAALPAGTGDGAIEIWGPTTITEPGHYVLTRDITIEGTGINDTLVITVSDVHVDLNGFRVRSHRNLGYAVAVGGPNENVTIENGKIEGGAMPLFVNGDDGPIHRLIVRNVVIEGSHDFVVKASGTSNSVFTDNIVIGGRGLWIGGSGNRIERNTFRASSEHGLQVVGHTSRVVDNIILDAADIGLHIGGNRNYVARNLMAGNGGYGLKFTGHNSVYRGNQGGGHAGTGCTGTGTADLCDQGIDNASHGDNYLPDQR